MILHPEIRLYRYREPQVFVFKIKSEKKSDLRSYKYLPGVLIKGAFSPAREHKRRFAFALPLSSALCVGTSWQQKG